MAYTNERLMKLSINAIRENTLIFREDLFAFVPFARSTFFARELHKSDTIKNEIWLNRVRVKHELEMKMLDSDDPTLTIALYKLLATDDELMRLNSGRQKYVPVKTEQESLEDVYVN